MSVEDRFWSKVKVGGEDECWPWTAGVNRRAVCVYGRFRVEPDRTDFAHRVAYKLSNGEIPDSAHICHTCGNCLCCNPAHLYAGDPASNAADTTRHGTRKGGALKGGSHHMAKLTNEERSEIGRRRSAGESASSLAREYRITTTHVYRLAKEQAEGACIEVTVPEDGW